jgi:hypothetical protein
MARKHLEIKMTMEMGQAMQESSAKSSFLPPILRAAFFTRVNIR